MNAGIVDGQLFSSTIRCAQPAHFVSTHPVGVLESSTPVEEPTVEFPFETISICVLQHASSMHLSLLPGPHVLVAIGELHDALAVQVSEFELPFISIVVGEDTRPTAVLLAVPVLAFVPPWPAGVEDELALAVEVPRDEFAVVAVPIRIADGRESV